MDLVRIDFVTKGTTTSHNDFSWLLPTNTVLPLVLVLVDWFGMKIGFPLCSNSFQPFDLN
jgi:hypothetical protein